MGLTVKQNEFVAEIAEGASQTSAYRSAYNTQNMSQKTIWEEASRLRRHPKVAARIMELCIEGQDLVPCLDTKGKDPLHKCDTQPL